MFFDSVGLDSDRVADVDGVRAERDADAEALGKDPVMLADGDIEALKEPPEGVGVGCVADADGVNMLGVLDGEPVTERVALTVELGDGEPCEMLRVVVKVGDRVGGTVKDTVGVNRGDGVSSIECDGVSDAETVPAVQEAV